MSILELIIIYLLFTFSLAAITILVILLVSWLERDEKYIEIYDPSDGGRLDE